MSTSHAIAATVPFLAAHFAASAQCVADWSQIASTGPSVRAYSALAYDSANSRVLLYGGGNRNTFYGDLYAWTGSAWSLLAPGGAGTPGNREAVASAYDSARQKFVVFGGAGITNSDTWEWNGSAWTPASSTGPTPRGFVASAFDAARGVTMFFGGWGTGFNYFDDTWTWNGSAWTQRGTGSPAPAPRGFSAAAYDPARQRVVLYGGLLNSLSGSTYYADTWEWDGQTWSQITPAHSPGPRGYHAMDYDPSINRVILYGGFEINGGNFNDTWAWNGIDWTLINYGAAAPLGRQAAPMTYDPVAQRHMLFGGVRTGSVYRNDTWAGVLGLAPVIDSQPVSLTVCRGAAATFVVSAANATGYQWRRDAAPISGANADSYTISSPTILDVAAYDCFVTSSCGSIASDPAQLTVCIADFNCDHSVDFFDYLDFVDAFAAMLANADVNADDSVDFFDYLDFVDAFANGC